MDESKKNIISEIVRKFAMLANFSNEIEINNRIERITSLDLSDAIDNILVSLDEMVNRGVISKQNVLDNAEILLQLDSSKYKSAMDFVERLEWIKAMNMEYICMPLKENHELVLEVFDKFNRLLNDKFDCYYTGGIMGYLAINKELERYHGDLDLFFNEEQLLELKELVDSSSEFVFVSNMNGKGPNGHEYSIQYKGYLMDIGLFLFSRDGDGIVTKGYYFDEGSLLVDERHFSEEYTKLCFSDEVRYHSDIPYKMMSLESIYNAKKDGRPKDRYDASVIKEYVDMDKERLIDNKEGHVYKVSGKKVKDCIIHSIERITKR